MHRRLGLPIGLSLVISLASCATLLVAAHPGTLGCPGSAATSVINCGAVISSTGGHILGLPLGFWGLTWVAVYWAALLRAPGSLMSLVCVAGFLGVAYAIGTELRVGHLCVWCTADQTAIVLLAVWTLKTRPDGRQGNGRQG